MWSLLIIWTVGPNIHIIWRLLLVRNRSSMRSWAAWVAKILDLLYSQTLHHYWLIGILCQWVDTGALLWILINVCQWSFWFNQIQKHPLCSTDYLSHIEIFFQMSISCWTGNAHPFSKFLSTNKLRNSASTNLVASIQPVCARHAVSILPAYGQYVAPMSQHFVSMLPAYCRSCG